MGDAVSEKQWNREPKELREAKCCTVFREDGSMGTRAEHEPDLEIESLLQAPQEEGTITMTPTHLIEMYNEHHPDRRVRVRVCKHCGCLYVEKT